MERTLLSSSSSKEDFRLQQRERARMSTVQLARAIARDHTGRNIIRAIPDANSTIIDSVLFPDEISALRFCVRMAARLENGGRASLSSLENTLQYTGGRGSQPWRQIKLKKTHQRRESNLLDDFVEVSSRISSLGEERLQLLIAYDVFGRKIRVIAEELGVPTKVMPGRVSQARRALRKALVGLIPTIEHSPGTKRDSQDPIEKKRQRVARLIRKRWAEGDTRWTEDEDERR